MSEERTVETASAEAQELGLEVVKDSTLETIDKQIETKKADDEFETSIAELTPEKQEIKRTERKASLNIEKTDEDYKAEIAKEKARGDKAENALAKKRIDDKDKKPTEKKVETDALSKDDVQAMIDKGVQATLKATQSTQADAIAERLTDSPAEKELTLLKWNNYGFPEGMSLEEQLTEAHILANSKRLLGKNNELKRALLGKKASKKDAIGTEQVGMETTEPTLSADVKKVFASEGFKYSTANNRYEKKLKGNKLMIGDPKTGRIRPEGHIEAPEGA